MMKRFIKNTIAFALLLLVSVYLIGEVKISDEFIIHKTANTSYRKVAWNINLIKNEPERIKNSTVFFGPSLVQGGVCDSTLSSNGVKAVNMGVNHFGNDLSLYFLERIKDLGAERVIFHKRKFNYTHLHKLSPLLYSPTKLLKSGQPPNHFFLRYLFKRTTLVMEYLVFIAEGKQSANQIDQHYYGIRYEKKQSYNYDTGSGLSWGERANFSVNEFQLQSEKGSSGLKVLFKAYYRRYLHFKKQAPLLNNGAQETFVTKASKICEERNIEFAKIYMPQVGDIEPEPVYNRVYYFASDSDGKIICLDDFTFLNDPSYWSDAHHLSKKGAIAFSKMLVDQRML